MGLASLAAAPVALDLGGKTYKVGPLTHLQIGMLQRYLDDHCRSPYELARAEAERLEVPADGRDAWLADARAASKGWKAPRVGIDPGWLPALVDHVEGVLYLLYVALERYQPAIAMDEVEGLLGQVDAGRLGELVSVLVDFDPDEGPDPGPKAR